MRRLNYGRLATAWDILLLIIIICTTSLSTHILIIIKNVLNNYIIAKLFCPHQYKVKKNNTVYLNCKQLLL